MYLTPHPSWQIIDSTKLKRYQECHRAYLFEYIFGWRSSQAYNDLAFGGAWAKAMEVLRKHGYSNDAITLAYMAFLEHYRGEGFDEESDELFFPKTPARALGAMAEYVELYSDDLRKYQVIHSEVAGSVPVSKNRVMYFKCDSILHSDELGYLSHEDKTTKSINRMWQDQWPLSTQVGCYSHVLYCLYPENEVFGVVINGTGFKPVKGTRGAAMYDFARISCRQSLDQMEAWLAETNLYLDELDQDMDWLADCEPDDRLMIAFKRNPQSCTKYRGCGYHHFCVSRTNPLSLFAQGLPIGFKVEHWNPMDIKVSERIDIPSVNK